MVPLHHPWMRPDRSNMHRHTQKHIPTLIDNIAVPPSVCLVGLSHHLREATPSPIQQSTPLPPSLSPLSLSLSLSLCPILFPVLQLCMDVDRSPSRHSWVSPSQHIYESFYLYSWASAYPSPTPYPHTHRYIERSSHVSLPHTNLTCAL